MQAPPVFPARTPWRAKASRKYSQFTGQTFTGALAGNGIAISMDGKDAWRDNVFVERLWRSVKYEEVYLRAYDSVSEARASIGQYSDFYNGRPPHGALTATHPIKPTSTRAHPHGSLIPAEDCDAENIMSVPEHADNSRGGCCSTQAGQAPKSCGLRPRPRFRNSGSPAEHLSRGRGHAKLCIL